MASWWNSSMGVSPERKVQLANLVRNHLGGGPAPEGWRTASVTLIPKVEVRQGARDYRPIIVLPALQKLVLRTWMKCAEPYTRLHRRTSCGFRKGHQCAEVHLILIHLLERRHDWGLPTTVVKLDIAAAHGTVSYAAISALIQRRGMPLELINAYWREHEGRRQAFRTTDGRVQFTVAPAQGTPQGPPESPMVYAALMEDMLGDIENELLANCLPAGVTLDRESSAAEVEAAKSTRRRF